MYVTAWIAFLDNEFRAQKRRLRSKIFKVQFLAPQGVIEHSVRPCGAIEAVGGRGAGGRGAGTRGGAAGGRGAGTRGGGGRF